MWIWVYMGVLGFMCGSFIVTAVDLVIDNEVASLAVATHTTVVLANWSAHRTSARHLQRGTPKPDANICIFHFNHMVSIEGVHQLAYMPLLLGRAGAGRDESDLEAVRNRTGWHRLII